jgi:hypothetical protein
MEEEENGPLFDGLVLTIIPSEDLTVRVRNDVRITARQRISRAIC